MKAEQKNKAVLLRVTATMLDEIATAWREDESTRSVQDWIRKVVAKELKRKAAKAETP